jgi:lipoprotein-anchoring transpeptidase ErfK/SrfK
VGRHGHGQTQGEVAGLAADRGHAGRRPDLPRYVAPGLDNPLGCRALYLFQGDRDTLYRIHGTNEPWTIGGTDSSGCIRLLNEDILDLYGRVPIGSMVVVHDHGRHGVAPQG